VRITESEGSNLLRFEKYTDRGFTIQRQSPSIGKDKKLSNRARQSTNNRDASMSAPTRHPALLCLALSMCILASACKQKYLRIPTPELDRAPAITVNGFVLGNTGWVGQSTINATTKVHSPSGTKLQLSVLAENVIDKSFGGVKELHLIIQQGTQILFDVAVEGKRNWLGWVPPSLGILGCNGVGGTGQQPLIFTMNSTPVIVTVTATNFHNTASLVVVTYLPKCDCDLGEEPDALCNCTRKICEAPQQSCLNGCCPLDTQCCNGACLPLGKECCSDDDTAPGQHCCSIQLGGGTCDIGKTCCGLTSCCGFGSKCVNGSCRLDPLDPLSEPLPGAHDTTRRRRVSKNPTQK
jgi:hypothetical protein